MGVPDFETQICTPVRKLFGQLIAMDSIVILGLACRKACLTSNGRMVIDRLGRTNAVGIEIESNVLRIRARYSVASSPLQVPWVIHSCRINDGSGIMLLTDAGLAGEGSVEQCSG